jgi:hypothetical protein
MFARDHALDNLLLHAAEVIETEGGFEDVVGSVHRSSLRGA